MFMAVSFTIAKRWNPTKFLNIPSLQKVYTQVVCVYSHTAMHVILCFEDLLTHLYGYVDPRQRTPDSNLNCCLKDENMQVLKS